MPNPKLFSVTRRRLLTGSVQAAVMIAALHFGPALAQDTSRAVIAQAYDAQPRNLLAFRGGNFPWIKNVFETLQSPVGVLVNEAQAIQYSFYTADELRRLSVVQVTSSGSCTRLAWFRRLVSTNVFRGP